MLEILSPLKRLINKSPDPFVSQSFHCHPFNTDEDRITVVNYSEVFTQFADPEDFLRFLDFSPDAKQALKQFSDNYMKKNSKNFNHLLNFKSYDPKEQRDYPSTHHARKTNIVPFRKEQFLQAHYRFIVSDTGDYSENVVDPDLPIDWPQVEQVCLQSHLEYNCPICLDNPVCAKVSRCGHVFCFVCILRHLSYSPKNIGHCPICFQTIHLKDLKSVVIETVPQYSEGDTIQFTLLKRAKHSAVALPKARWRHKNELYPLASDPDTKFSRFAITEDIAPIIERETKELQQAAWDANSSQDDSIPFVACAQTELDERQNRALQQRKLKPKRKEQSLTASDEIQISATKQPEKEPIVPAEDYSNAWDEPAKHESSMLPDQNSVKAKEWEQEMEELKSSMKLVDKADNSLTQSLDRDPNELKHKQQKLEKPGIDISEEFYYIYQASDGQQLFLHPMDYQILLNEYGSHEMLPDTIEGKIIEEEDMTQTEATVKRYRFLGHLPLTSQFQFIELDMRPLVRRESLYPFMDDIQKRIRRRKDRKRKEEDERKRQEEEAKARFADIDMEQFPSRIFTILQEDAEFETIPEELLKEMEQETTPTLVPEKVDKPESPSATKTPPVPIHNNHKGSNSVWNNRTPPKQPQIQSPSPPAASFLAAAKSNKLYIPPNLPTKNSKQGKQVILLSTSNGRRSYR